MNSKVKTILIHGGLFLLTLFTTTLAGAEKSIYLAGYTWSDFESGFAFSVPFLLVLTVHEFGHYFTAVYNRIKVSLPYYIPLPPPFLLGTLGALIRIKERPDSKQHFDIGIAGPLAGFVLAFIFLWYGFTHLPPLEYIYHFHPEYEKYGADYANFVYKPENMPEGTVDLVMGSNLLLMFFQKFVADPGLFPNPHEFMHYPLLVAGFWSLVFTSINLLPIGQLDGGHVLYGLVGYKKHRVIATVFMFLLLFYSGLGVITPDDPLKEFVWGIPLLPVYVGFLYVAMTGMGFSKRNTLMYAVILFTVQYLLVTVFPGLTGYQGWFVFAFIIGRFVGVRHPASEIEAPLSNGRKVLGWLALVVFVLCFTPNPIQIIESIKAAP